MTQTMIDVTGASLPGLLAALGPNLPDVMAGYVTGTQGVDWPAAAWTQLHGKTGLFRYDQSPGLALFKSGASDGADLEAGAGQLAAAVDGSRAREAHGWWSWWYFSHLGGTVDLAQARQAVADNKLTRTQFIVADWSMSLAQATGFLAANGDVKAVQWASPSSNPQTPVPGAGGRTLAELNCDLNVTADGWFAVPKPPPRALKSVTVAFSDSTFVTYQ